MPPIKLIFPISSSKERCEVSAKVETQSHKEAQRSLLRTVLRVEEHSRTAIVLGGISES